MNRLPAMASKSSGCRLLCGFIFFVVGFHLMQSISLLSNPALSPVRLVDARERPVPCRSTLVPVGKASPCRAKPEVCSPGAMPSISPFRLHNHLTGRPGSGCRPLYASSCRRWALSEACESTADAHAGRNTHRSLLLHVTGLLLMPFRLCAGRPCPAPRPASWGWL